MDVENVAIDSVRLDAGNVRKHSKRNLETILRSLKEFGQQKPIVVGADGVVVAGNGTLDAARALGWTHIDVVRTELEGSARKAYAVADNRTAELAEWDETGLAEYLAGLKADERFDETVTGFDEGEIERLIGAPEVVEDETPPVPETPITQPGDLWLLGDHRVLCGDATKAEDVGRLDVDAVLMVTDPPYGVEYAPQWRQDAAAAGHLAYGATSLGKVAHDDRSSWLDAYKLFQGNVAYVWHASASAVQFATDLMESGFEIRAQIIWRKPTFAISRGHYHWQHEPCWYCVRKGASAGWIGDRSQTTIWDVSNRQVEHSEHGTQKPIEIMLRPIRNHSGDVYDPFLGSGTTLIAAEQLGRKCYGIEIEPKYVDVTLKRWANLTGKQPIREADGKTFAELEAGPTSPPALT